MGVMLVKEQIEKNGIDRVDFLVESLAHSMALAAQSAKAQRTSSPRPGPKRLHEIAVAKAKHGRIPVIVRPGSEGEARSLVRLAIDDLERTHPGLRVAFLDKDTLALAEEIREYLPEIRDAKSEERIAKLIGALVEFNDPLAEPRQKIDKANAELRVKFMRAFETFSSTEIAEHDNRQDSANPHNLASRWKAAGKIFAVEWQGQQRFPAFQFDHGKPRPLIGKALKIFDGALGPWETAFWFVSSNKWLDGKAPVDVLADKEGIVRAAYSTTGEHFG